jgi:hypothetical protein
MLYSVYPFGSSFFHVLSCLKNATIQSVTRAALGSRRRKHTRDPQIPLLKPHKVVLSSSYPHGFKGIARKEVMSNGCTRGITTHITGRRKIARPSGSAT